MPAGFSRRTLAMVSAPSASKVRAFVFAMLCACLVFVGDVKAGAQTATFSGAQVALGSGFQDAAGVTVDGSGNVFVADFLDSAVKEILPDGVILTLGGGFDLPLGIAVDGSGNVYVADYENSAVKEIPPGCAIADCVKTLGGGFNYPSGVAVDGSGNLFVADSNNGAVKEIPPGCLAASCVVTLCPAGNCNTAGYSPVTFVNPSGVAVDGSGNVFVADSNLGAVYEITPASSYRVVTTLASGNNFVGCGNVAVDRFGNVYVTSYGSMTPAVYEIQAVNGSIPAVPTIVTLGSGWTNPFGVAVDGNGDVFVGDSRNTTVTEVETTSVDFGEVAIGQTSTPISLTFTFTGMGAGTIGTPVVLTKGAAALDFADAGTGTCTSNATSYTFSAGNTCTVNVTFKPTLAGVRNGAVLLQNASGVTIATGYVHGIGTGSQVSFLPGKQSPVGTGFGYPAGVAVDGGGNVFVADTYNNQVKEVLAAGGYATVNPLGSGFNYPTGVAVDGSGNVFVADFNNGEIKEIPYSCVTAPTPSCVQTLGGDAPFAPLGVAVDRSGNVFVADTYNNAVKEILAAGGYSTVLTLGSGFAQPTGVAVDESGNVFVADFNNNAVKEILAWGGYTTVNTLAGGFNYPTGITVDMSGNVFVVDTDSNVVKEILAAGGYTTVNTLASAGLFYPYGVAVDGKGNVYIADTDNNRVVQLDYADAPSLNFGSVPSNASSAEQTVTLQNIGNAPLMLTGIQISPYFTVDLSAAMACNLGNRWTPHLLYDPGTSCTLGIGFAPTVTGSIGGSLILTDYSVNETSPVATQTINLSGTGLPAVQTINFPNPGTQTYGAPPITLAATSSVNASPITYTVLSGPATVNNTTSQLTITGAGTVAVQANSAGNSSLDAATASISITVNPAPLSVTVNSASRAYGASNPGFSGAIAGLLNSDTLTAAYGSAATVGSPVGLYPITATLWGAALSNYSVTVTPGTLTVGKAALTVTANNLSKVYGAVMPALTYTITGFVQGDTSAVVTGTPTLTTAATAASVVAGYPITAAVGTLAASNYSFTFAPGTLTVTPAVLTVTANNLGKVYGAALPASGMVNMHYGTLLGTPCLAGQACSIGSQGPVVYTVASAVSAGSVTLPVTSTTGPLTGDDVSGATPGTGSMVQGELLSILELDGVYRTNIVESISGTTVTLGRPSVAGISVGANVWDAWYNPYHLSVQGFYAVADDWALGSAITAPRELVQSFINLYNTTPYTLDYSTTAASVAVSNSSPSTTANPAVLFSPATGHIGFHIDLGTLAEGSYLVEVVGQKSGTAGPLVENVTYSDGYSTSYPAAIGQYDQTLHSFTEVFPGRGQDAVLYIDTAATSSDTLTVGYINVYRITAAASPLSTYSRIACLGDSWFSEAAWGQPIVSRLQADLPNATIFNNGIGGQTLNQMAVRFFADVAPEAPQLVITLSGTNDYVAGESAGLVASYERQIQSYTASIGASPLAINASVGPDGAGCPSSCPDLELSREYAQEIYVGDPSFAYTITGYVNGDTSAVVTGTATLTTTAAATSVVGTYPITEASSTLTASNYTFTFMPGTLTVTPAPLTVTVNSASKVYSAPSPAFSGTISGLMTGDVVTATYSATATAASPVGSYPITATLSGAALGNYSPTITPGTLTITKAALTVTANNASKVYGAANPAFTDTISGFVNGDTSAVVTGTASLTTTAEATSVVGGYPITAAAGTLAASNYSFTFAPGTLTVTPAPLTVTVNSASKAYGASNPAFSGTIAGLKNSDTLTAAYSSVATAGSPVGSYPITATLWGAALTNYSPTVTPGTLTVGKAALTVTANNLSKVYGAVMPALTYTITGFAHGDTSAVVTGTPTLTTAATAASVVAAYPITAAVGTLAASNYSFTFAPGTLTLTPAALTVTANNLGKVYGALNPALTYAISGYVNGNTSAVVSGTATLTTTAITASAVGSYPITEASSTLAASNYTFVFVPGTLTVTPAPLTVKVNSASKVYGASKPAFSGTITGLMTGDVVTATYSAAATAASPVGSYPITATLSGAALGNYSPTITPGTLTITKAVLTVTANNASKVYGATSSPVFTDTISGFVNEDTSAVVSGTATLATTATATSVVGTYPITEASSTLAASNYTFAFVPGTLTVTPAPLTVTVNSASRSYGASNPAFSGTIAGLKNSDTLTAAYSSVATAGSPVGSYPITATLWGAKAGNYSFTVTPGTLTVGKAALTVTANNASRAYGTANPALTYTITGFAHGDTSAVVSGTASLTTTATTTSAAGSYPITFSTGGLTASNYSFTYVKGTLTITAVIPTISTLSPNSATAAGAAFTLTINGANFFSGAVAKWGTTALTTTYVSATKLTAVVPADLIETAGTASVTVTTGGGTSAAATFTIQ